MNVDAIGWIPTQQALPDVNHVAGSNERVVDQTGPIAHRNGAVAVSGGQWRSVAVSGCGVEKNHLELSRVLHKYRGEYSYLMV